MIIKCKSSIDIEIKADVLTFSISENNVDSKKYMLCKQITASFEPNEYIRSLAITKKILSEGYILGFDFKFGWVSVDLSLEDGDKLFDDIASQLKEKSPA